MAYPLADPILDGAGVVGELVPQLALFSKLLTLVAGRFLARSSARPYAALHHPMTHGVKVRFGRD